jgi:uroporphyrinogen decarboxylase
MTSRERVIRCLDKAATDRVPIFMWFHPQTKIKLGAYLGIAASAVDTILGNDVRQTWVNNNYAMEGVVHEADGDGHIDEWGIHWQKRYGFNQIVRHPLKGVSPEAVLRFRFPDPTVHDFMKPMSAVTESSEGYYLGCDVSPCGFEMYWRLRGMEDALLDFATDPSLAREMVGRCVDWAILLSEEAIRRFPLDWLWTGDDVAAQNGMILHPDLWRSTIKPELQRIFSFAKRKGLRIAYHCCGALRPIIPDLIEMGMDVLNPVQAGCPGMDPIELKREYGADIAFMGGVDTEHLLPHGTPEEVGRATGKLIGDMTGDGGGYILAASHTIPPETPIDNILAMYAAAGLSAAEIMDHAERWRQARP